MHNFDDVVVVDRWWLLINNVRYIEVARLRLRVSRVRAASMVEEVINVTEDHHTTQTTLEVNAHSVKSGKHFRFEIAFRVLSRICLPPPLDQKMTLIIGVTARKEEIISQQRSLLVAQNRKASPLGIVMRKLPLLRSVDKHARCLLSSCCRRASRTYRRVKQKLQPNITFGMFAVSDS